VLNSSRVLPSDERTHWLKMFINNSPVLLDRWVARWVQQTAWLLTLQPSVPSKATLFPSAYFHVERPLSSTLNGHNGSSSDRSPCLTSRVRSTTHQPVGATGRARPEVAIT